MTSSISQDPSALNLANAHIDPIFMQKEIDFPSCLSRVADLTKKNPYLACNENSQEEVLASLKSKEQLKNAVHFGFACEFNYNIIALRKPLYAFICDISPDMHLIYAQLKKLMLDHPSLDTFKVSLRNLLKEYSVTSATSEAMDAEELLQHLSREVAFLSNQESYAYVRLMYQANAIFHLNLDIAKNNTPAFQSIKRWLDDRNCVVDTLYASNIVEWLKLEDQQAEYRRNLEHLVYPGRTSFIYAKRLKRATRPTQIMANAIPQDYIASPKKQRMRAERPSNNQLSSVVKRLNFND